MASHSLPTALPAMIRAVRLLSAIFVLSLPLSAGADEPAKADVPNNADAIVPPSPMPDGADSAAPAIAAKRDALWQDRPLAGLKAAIKPTQGELPPNAASPRLAQSGTQHFSMGDSRPWMFNSSEWDAPATRHLPLFFE